MIIVTGGCFLGWNDSSLYHHGTSYLMIESTDITACPFVSIVLATHNRLSLLQDTLDTLFAQAYPKDRFEIIVVDDSSTDGTGEWLRAQPVVRDGVAFTAITLPPSGPSKARNTGIRQARGEYVMITDDDCLIDHACLAELVNAMLHRPCGGIGGRIVCKERPGIISRYCTHIRFNVTAEDDDTPLRFINTANSLFPSEVLRAVGGFDEQFRHLGSIDMDLSQRIVDCGHILHPCTSAVVLHLNKVTMRSLHKAFFNQARGMAYIHAKRHPRHGLPFVTGYALKLLLNFIRLGTEMPVRILWNLLSGQLPVVDACLFPLLDRTTKICGMWGRIKGRIMYWRLPKTLPALPIDAPELPRVG
jgi:glycosyltransferase involved in cell wall biosynthesis